MGVKERIEVAPDRHRGDDAKQVALELRTLEKAYGATRAVAGIDLVTEPGEFITLLGPSGSGKTTTLNLIAGFLQPDGGDILVDGVSIVDRPPHRRNIGVVFQSYLLFPHMTAERNIAFPLRRRKLAGSEIERRVSEALELVGLSGLGDRYPRELSGGQQQRVALARAIVFRPPLLLMDEPLGALDRNLRESLQLEIKRIHRELGTTFVYVTHDQGEALVLSDRIAIFNHGRIEQIASPNEVYEQPQTEFVARFVGDSNIFHGTIRANGGGNGVLSTPTLGRLMGPADAPSPQSATASLLVRPEKVHLGVVEGASNRLEGVVTEVAYLGATLKFVVAVGPESVTVHGRPSLVTEIDVGKAVEISWRAEESVWLTGP